VDAFNQTASLRSSAVAERLRSGEKALVESSHGGEGSLNEGNGRLNDTPLERPALYVVAMPIGNVGDITLRALEVLRNVDVLFAEDTRVLKELLTRLEVPVGGRPVLSCHDFNEERAAASMASYLKTGQNAAMVSDAGTPLISDPGFTALRHVREELGWQSIPVHPVPGPCAAVAALSVAGMPALRYLFMGFPPAKRGAKRTQLQQMLRQAQAGLPATLVLYESSHRILSTLEVLAELLEHEGSESASCEPRRVAVCRELTKRYETLLFGEARTVLQQVAADTSQQKGEFVVLVEGGKRVESNEPLGGVMSASDVVRLLATELPNTKAAHLAAKICGGSKRQMMDELFAGHRGS